MKKIFFIMAIAAIAIQTAAAQMTSFGVTAGAVVSNYSAKAEGEETPKLDSKIGLTFGIMSNIPISKSLSFQPAINYVQKGASFKEDETKATLKLNYLELPLNFVYTTPEKNGHFFIGAGPCISYGIAAKLKVGDVEIKGSFGSGEDDVAKPLEICANILMGYQFAGGLNIAANYNRGLNNISTDGSGSTKEHNYYVGFRIGYMLTGISKK